MVSGKRCAKEANGVLPGGRGMVVVCWWWCVGRHYRACVASGRVVIGRRGEVLGREMAGSVGASWVDESYKDVAEHKKGRRMPSASASLGFSVVG